MGKNKDGETLYFAGGVDNARLCVTSDINLAVDLHAELITKNVEIYIRKVAPLGDPIELNLRGYELTIRKADAEMVEIE